MTIAASISLALWLGTIGGIVGILYGYHRGRKDRS